MHDGGTVFGVNSIQQHAIIEQLRRKKGDAWVHTVLNLQPAQNGTTAAACFR